MALPQAVASALRWPMFVFSVSSLFWSLTIVCATHHLQWLNLRHKRSDVLGWAKGMKALHRYKVLKVGSQELYRKKCMYLCNHRSWADFMVDQYVTEGRSLFMSRWAVVAVFPMFMTANYFIRTVLIFKRGAIRNKARFNAWIDRSFANSPQTGLAVYPEGHRSTNGESLPLKRGMLHYAYDRKLPTQVVIGANKEAVLSERHCTARLGQTIAVGFSEVIRAEDYPDFEQYMAAVQATWDKQWDAVFSADWAGLPELPDVEADFDFPADVRAMMLVIPPIHFAVTAAAAWATFRLARAVLGLLGPLQLPALLLFAAYVAASFYVYSEPVDALTLHKEMQQQRRVAPPAREAAAARDKSS